ncbi:breast cancer type 1 susceptibility protein [Dryobates pubescens]|uniref:breast cancer type 1 susceptibility protein n=1 Tax=Dryobates pubescens TaxID=118200 RepID=UPI0023B99528|nr:breast cancer type 1 susceptibility protein [Dryobates pubescens]
MDSSVMSIGDVQNVLSAMQKNLECAICLDVVKEPVSTKCDHVFCRFCIFKLFSEKKKGVVACPLCKTEVTKRSLKENSRFKQLIEALLETIHAFELDTGVKILNSHDLPKTSTEATAADLLCKEHSVIQSKGFRNRKKGIKGNGQETCTLEAKVDTQPADTRVKQCRLRNKTQKCDPEKGLYIEFGSDSSEELFKQQSNARSEDKAGLHISSQEQKSAEEGKGCCLNAQPDKLAAKGGIHPDIPGESDFSKEGLSKRSTRSTTECAKPVQVNVTGCQSSPLNVAVELLREQCDRAGPESPQRGDTSSFQKTEAANAEQTWCSSKSKEFGLKDSSESSLDESKELDSVVKIVEMYKPENDSFCENELALEKLLQPEMLHCTALVEVSRKRLKRSIEKVNEWFSKSNEFLTSSSSQDNSAGAAVLDSGDVCLSDRDSCISEKTDPMEIAVDEGNRESRPTAGSIKDKIFGKTYERERKSTPLTIWRDILPSTKQEVVGSAEKCLNDSSKDRLKRKRKTVCVLQPEDFIKQKDTEWADGSPQSVNCCFGGAEKKRHDERSAVNESHLSENREGNAVAALEEGGGSIQKKATAKVTGKHCDRELELSKSDQKSTKKSTAAKRCRSSTRAMCALQLVLDRNSLSPDPAEPQIDSYPSSEEARKVDCEQRQVRCSRRLRLLSGEMTKEMGKGAVVKGARTSGSDGEEPFGVQSNVLVHTSEHKDLCEPQGVLSHKLLPGLQADKMLVSLKNSPDAEDAGRSLFNPPAMCQRSNCSSAPDAGVQGDEIQGSPFLLQSPSVTGVQPPDPAEEVTELCIPQSSGHDIQSVPEDLKTEKLPVAKAAWDLTKEAADSELDTQCLRGIFRQSKRLSFSLYPALSQGCAAEGAAAETLKVLCADQIENEHSKHLNTENFQEDKAAESLSRICEKEELKTCDSVCVSPVTCFDGNTESMDIVEHEEDVSQFANQETLTPVRVGAARIENENRLPFHLPALRFAVSAAVGIGGELRQNAVRSPSSQSDQSNAAELPFRTAAAKTDEEICFSSGSNQAHKAKVVDSKGPVLHSQSRSMISAAPEQRPAEFRGEVIGKKSSKREQKPVKGNKGEAAQRGGTGLPECLVPEAPEELLKGNGGFTHLSETADGLLCSDDDTEENSSFSETDRREKSAVFVKRSDCALMKDMHNRNADSEMNSQGVQRSRRRVQKLPSSDEESSESEDLPCFQTLIFGKSVSTPLQDNKQVASVAEFSASPSNGSHDDSNVQKLPKAAPGNGCLSLSQESECSINLFSSQSNNSEESADGAQEPKKLSAQANGPKQVNNESESKEVSRSCNGRLKRSKTNFKDECQEDPNVGANLASGYDSETSNVEDSCGLLSQGEILTTQQKNAMQNNLKKLQEEMAVLEAVLQQHGSQDSQFPPVHGELPRSSSKGTFGMEQRSQERENADEQKSGTRLNSPPVVSNLLGNVTGSPSNSPSSAKLLHPVTAAAAKSSATALLSTLSCTQEGESKSSVCFPLPVLHSATGKECAAVTDRKAMSIVASGLKQSERLVVQKFARKTRSTLSDHITEGTTHVIMKTDKELVCERTLKYFLGIAGRKWVVSYQWVIQSFEEGRILDEENFEVRGDVINGRNHQGPKRARESLTEKIFKDFEICCCGPFTGMTTEHLEWMVELCGASVVKQLHLFTHTKNSAIVVVQPDAWTENTDYRAIQQKNSIAMVTREWVLDSVACYECQELDAYLVS